MLRIGHAILHVFDFESGSTFFSERELDLDNRQTRSYVTRRLRRIRSSAESKHGTFAPESNFASGLKEYLAGQVPFVDFSVQIAQWFWEELRRAEDLEQCDLLVADFTDTGEMRASENADEDKVADAYESEGTRLFAVVLLPRKQAFIQQCSQEASSHEVIDEVTSIVEDLSEEYGLTPAVEVSRAKAALARHADTDEAIQPADVGREVFEDNPEMAQRFEERTRERDLPEEVPVRRGAANRLTCTHRIRTDTGVEIAFPSELAERPGYIEFSHQEDGSISIVISNVARIENR